MPERPNLLFISHCIPYPPDKGEKIRAFNLVKHLSKTHQIHLGCLVDRPEDLAHLKPLREWCASVDAFPIDRRRQKLSALLRIRPGRPLMLDYYRHPALHAWTRATMDSTPIDLAFIYTVAMMPYVEHLAPRALVLDAVDIDSEKWTAYAQTAALPMRYIWSREGRTLLAYERRAALASNATLFVSPQETNRFAQLAPEAAPRLHAIENGVDLEHFSPAHHFDNPYTTPGPHLVFTGTMDYWPNADAVTWFTTQILPSLRPAHPGIEFHIVGANPPPAVRALAARPGVHVTGRVPDVRPYVAHAHASVAPLRIARGIQNKVLEAMAMARPVIASPQAFEGIRATPGHDLLVADGPAAIAAAVDAVLRGAYPTLAAAGRRAVEAGYAWPATLARLDTILQAAVAPDLIDT